jgi:hypothetical protein
VERPVGAEEELGVLEELAKAIAKELLLIQHGRLATEGGGVSTPHKVRFQGSSDDFDVASTYLAEDNEKEGFSARFFSETGAVQIEISGAELRSRNPKTGDKLDDTASEQSKPSDGIVQHYSAKKARLFPAKVERKGRYGYAVEYADGATIIYSMFCIARAAGGTPTR